MVMIGVSGDTFEESDHAGHEMVWYEKYVDYILVDSIVELVIWLAVEHQMRVDDYVDMVDLEAEFYIDRDDGGCFSWVVMIDIP